MGKVCFRSDERGWIYLSEKLGKVIVRAHEMGKVRRKTDPKTQHRAHQFWCNKTVKVKSKLWEISRFEEKEKKDDKMQQVWEYNRDES